MNYMVDRLYAHPATLLQAWAETFIGVSLPKEVCGLLILGLYTVLAAGGLQACLRLGWKGRPGAFLLQHQTPQVVLLGPSASGKTRCLLALRNGRATETVPSLSTNRCEIALRSLLPATAATGKEDERGAERLAPSVEGTTVQIVDAPGHQRLRAEALAAAAAATLLIFIVDAADKPSLKGAAEFLYELFCHPKIAERRPPLLLVANKRDKPEAKAQQAVIEDIEREIERCRVSRQLTFEGEDVAAGFIGQHGRIFMLQEDAPCPVEFCSAAVGVGDLSEIPNFILRHAM